MLKQTILLGAAKRKRREIQTDSVAMVAQENTDHPN